MDVKFSLRYTLLSANDYGFHSDFIENNERRAVSTRP